MAFIAEYIFFILLGLGLGLGGLPGLESAIVEAAPSSRVKLSALKPDYHIPPQVSLCGEDFDLTKPYVYERLEYEFLRVVNHPAQIALWQRRAATYFPYIEAELRKAGLPEDLKYLAVAESDLRPWVVSPAGALGLWQFMPATARHFGLSVNKKIDQRQLPEPLLGAAIRYFKSLKNKFGTWSLAMAAYNAGDGRIAKARSQQGQQSYFDLDLPRETERYVYRIAAIKIVLENAVYYGFTEPVPYNYYQAENFVERRVNVAAGTNWAKLAKELSCDYKTLRLLNPHYNDAPAAGTQLLRLPAGR